MDTNKLYDISRVRRNEFYSTKPDYIEKADIYPIVHDNTMGVISGCIEVSLDTGNAYASYTLLEVTRDYTDEPSCKKGKEEVVTHLVDYYEKTFCAEEIKHIWQYIESEDFKWHQYTKYSLPYSSYIKDVYGIYDTIKMCEVAIFLTKPEVVKKVKLIPYFQDLGYDEDDDTSATLMICIDARIEKEDEYTQLIWTCTSDGYDENRSKEEAEKELVCEMLFILEGTLSDEEIQTFWEDIPWNRDWKKKKTV